MGPGQSAIALEFGVRSKKTPGDDAGRFFIPLRAADALELDRCAETPDRFSPNSRWKAPIQHAVTSTRISYYSFIAPGRLTGRLTGLQGFSSPHTSWNRTGPVT